MSSAAPLKQPPQIEQLSRPASQPTLAQSERPKSRPVTPLMVQPAKQTSLPGNGVKDNQLEAAQSEPAINNVSKLVF